MRKTKGGIRILLRIVAAFCTLYLIWSGTEGSRSRRNMEGLKREFQEADLEREDHGFSDKENILTDVERKEEEMTQNADAGAELLPAFAKLKQKYPELVAWLTIEGTEIDYPVMQSVDDEFYLNHDPSGRQNRHGSLFVKIKSQVSKPESNLIIYGHNMKDGTMFGGLKKYKDMEYFKKHPYITFHNLYNTSRFQVIAVFEARVYGEGQDGFRYYDVTEIETEEAFEDFYHNIKQLSLYDTGIDANYGDSFLTLSTCDYEEKDGRFVVVAKEAENKIP